MDEVKLCPWLLFVPWCWEWRVWGSVKKFAVEWIDFEKITSKRMFLVAHVIPRNVPISGFYCSLFVGDTKFYMCFYSASYLE